VIASVANVTTIMAQISEASSQQSGAIDAVNSTITEMDQVTQQNAALVEQASAAAEALQDQALQLAKAVRAFKIDAPAAGRALAGPARSLLPR
jgi:methyl-accepting chemotaxis protein